MNKGRITYRFEPDGRRVLPEEEQQPITLEADEAIELLEEDEVVQTLEQDQERETKILPIETKDGQYLNQFTNDFGAWSSPFHTETEKLENLIRETDVASSEGQAHVVNSSRKREHERPMLGYEQEMDNISDSPLRYIRRSSKAWLKIITSFMGAIVTGLILGILVLSFFTSEESSVDAVPGEHSPDPIQRDSEGNETTELAGPADEPDGPAALAVEVPAESYVLLQNGVFSTREAAAEAIANLRKQGFAAAMLAEDQYFVFAGVLNNRDDALALSRVLQTSDFETFIKTFELAAIRELDWGTGDTSNVEAYFTGAHRLVQMLIDFSAIHLQNGASSPLENSSIEAVRNVHQTWNIAASSLTVEDEAVKSIIERMNTELNAAVLSLEEYHKSPSTSYQWEIQHSILEFLLQYKQFTDRT